MKSSYFFAIVIKDKETETIQPLSTFKNVIDNICNELGDQGQYHTVDISLPDDTMKTIVDIFDNTDQRLFARFSKQRPNSSIVGRNYHTLKTEPVMGAFPDNEKGIENYSFVYVNYQTLIAEIAPSQYSPEESALANLINKCSEYFIEFLPIPNRIGIDRIFTHRKPVISSFTVDIPTPTPALLEEFGFNGDDINELFGNNIRAKIMIAPIHGTTLASNEGVPSVVEKIRQSASVTNAIFKARSATDKTREYNLYDETFKYDIDIPTVHIEKGKSISYSEQELINSAREKLIANYNINHDIIVPLANRG